MKDHANRTLVIAEIGENHIGDWNRAEQMIVEAAGAGADVVKFQSYLGRDVAPDDPEREWFTSVQLPDAEHFRLKAIAEREGVRFLTAPFSLERGRFVIEELGLREVKVASSEMLNFALLDYLNGRVDTVYLSTGMASLDEVRAAVSRLDRVEHVCILHCTTEYPCSVEHANLAAIKTLRAAFPGHSIGFSDHTIGVLAPLVAVSLGARVVEKHFTIDKSLPGTDHVLSLTPYELAELVRNLRTVECLLGNDVKEPTDTEIGIRDFVRKRFPKS